MNWASAADFWSMGGYGFFVWGSYASLVAVVAAEVVLLRARRSRAVSEIAQGSVQVQNNAQSGVSVR
ncbi:MAG: heme exporter protein CcmD [Burkholderiaceae bacterium]